MARDFSDIYEAMRIADEKGNTDDVAKLAAYLEAESAKPEAAEKPETYDPRDKVGALLPAAGGAIAGAVVPPMLRSGIKAVEQGRVAPGGALSRAPVVPEGHTPFNPRGVSVEQSLQNWKNYNEAQLEAAKKVRQESALHKKYPGFTRAGTEPVRAPIAPNATAAERIVAKALPGGVSDVANFAKGVYDYKLPFVGGIGSLAARGLVGAGAGMQGADAYNRAIEGDTTGAVISGIGGLGTAATLLPFLPAKVLGTGVGLSAEAINAYRDAMRKGRIEHTMPGDYGRVDAMGNAYAQGGLVELPHLAIGGITSQGFKNQANRILPGRAFRRPITAQNQLRPAQPNPNNTPVVPPITLNAQPQNRPLPQGFSTQIPAGLYDPSPFMPQAQNQTGLGVVGGQTTNNITAPIQTGGGANITYEDGFVNPYPNAPVDTNTASFVKEGGLVHLAKGGQPDAPWNQKIVPNPEDLMGTFSYAPGYYGEVADRINPEGQSAGINDALRHMLAAGDIARRVNAPIRASGLSSITPGGIPLVSENVGPAVARGLGAGHEIMNYLQNIGGKKPQTNEDLAQDLYNNAVGAQLGGNATSFQDLINKMPAAIDVRPYQKEKGKALIRHPDEVGTPYKPFKLF